MNSFIIRVTSLIDGPKEIFRQSLSWMRFIAFFSLFLIPLPSVMDFLISERAEIAMVYKKTPWICILDENE